MHFASILLHPTSRTMEERPLTSSQAYDASRSPPVVKALVAYGSRSSRKILKRIILTQPRGLNTTRMLFRVSIGDVRYLFRQQLPTIDRKRRKYDDENESFQGRPFDGHARWIPAERSPGFLGDGRELRSKCGRRPSTAGFNNYS